MKKITCGRCGLASYNLNDIKNGFCGNCHAWTDGVVTTVYSTDPGPKPEWAIGNSLVKVRTCPHCGQRWWEHDHSASEFIRHLKQEHADIWDKAVREADAVREQRERNVDTDGDATRP